MKKKKYIIPLIIMMIMSFFINNVYATEDLGDLNQYVETEIEVPLSLIDKAEIIVSIIQSLGVVISVVVLIIIGFKYMLGSVEERAEYKKTFIPYLVGAILVFSISTLPQLIYTFIPSE